MKSHLFLPAAAVLFTLSACNSQPSKPEVVDTNPDPMAAELANKGAVELPPGLDNSLVYVTFFQGDKQAIVKTKKDGAPTTLKAEKAGDPLVADGGWKLTGDTSHITLSVAGKGEQTCKA